MPREIILKTAKKKPGTVSSAKVRRIVAKVYAIPLAELVASIPKNFGDIIVTKTSIPLARK